MTTAPMTATVSSPAVISKAKIQVVKIWRPSWAMFDRSELIAAVDDRWPVTRLSFCPMITASNEPSRAKPASIASARCPTIGSIERSSSWSTPSSISTKRISTTMAPV